MAKDVRVDIRSTLDGKGFEQSEAGLDKTAAAAKRAQRPIDEVNSSASKLDRTLLQLAKRAAVTFLGFKAGQSIKDVTLLAARFETLGVVMDVVGRNAGFNSAQMQTFSQEVQDMGITMNQARQTVIGLAQAEIDLSKAGELARIAQDAAVIGQINSSEALERMIHGLRTAQPELLRNIGLTVSFEQAYAKQAGQLGKNTDELSNAEKAQARLNAVQEAGARIAGTYEAALSTAGKQLGSMARHVETLETLSGEVFQTTLIVATKSLTESLEAANAELKTLKEAGQLEEWGDDLARILAWVADRVNNLTGKLQIQSLAVKWLHDTAAAIGPGFSEEFDRIQQEFDTKSAAILASQDKFQAAVEKHIADREARRARGGSGDAQHAGTEFSAQDDGGGKTETKQTDDEKLLEKLLSGTATARASEYERQLGLLRTEVNAGRVSYAQYIEVVDLLTDAFERSDPVIQQAKKRAEELDKIQEERARETGSFGQDLIDAERERRDEEARATGAQMRELFEQQVEARIDATAQAERYVQALQDETVMMQSSEKVRNHMIDSLHLEAFGIERGSVEWNNYVDALARVREVQDKVNESFSLGAGRAFEVYMRDVRDVAGATEDLFTRSFENMEDAMVDWLKTGKFSLDEFGREFEAMVLRMIVQQQLLGPLAQSAAGAFSFFGGGTSGDVAFDIGHAGAVAGIEASGRKRVDPAVFSGAPRFHGGGITGDEVPIIARRGEGVFTPEQMKRLSPIGAEQSVRVEIVNNGTPQQVTNAQPTFDPKGMIVRIVTQDLQDGGPISRTTQTTFGLKRGG